MRKLFFMFSILLMATAAKAQSQESSKTFKAFNHLDLSVTLGSTGIGFDVASPIGDYVQLRTGLAYMPRFEKRMHFDIQSFDDKGNVIERKFDKLSDLMHDVTGYNVDDHVDMIGRPTYWNFKFLVDVFPFRNKHWHFTVGFHWGPSKFADAVNATEDAPSLFAVGMYNNIYDHVSNSEIIRNPEEYFMTHNLNDVLSDIHLLQSLGVNISNLPIPSDVYLDPDNNFLKSYYEKIYHNGRAGIRVGNYVRDIVDEQGNVIHRAGEPYRMEPDQNSMVSATAYVNSFKPYLGFGYGGRLIKNNDAYHISFDCGLMFWGGTPDVITHDGTNLTKDVQDISGKVGRYVRTISDFKVFPVLNVRLTRRLF